VYDPTIIALAALGLLFLVLLSFVVMREPDYDPTTEEIEMKLRIQRHNRHLETMVLLEAELGRIPTPREVWDYELAVDALEDISGEIRDEISDA